MKTGDHMPDFEAKNQDGEVIKSSELAKGKSLVVYFYPKDDSPGCTAEACSFRDQYTEFSDIGAEVVGISGDSVSSHKKFQQKYNLPFMLLSDPDRKIEKLFSVKRDLLGLLPGRVTYVFDPSRTLIYTFSSQINARAHVKETLKILQTA